MMDLLHTNTQLFTSQDINWWTGVVWITCRLLWCFYQLFGLSFWRHPFTAEHPLVSKWYNTTSPQIYSDEKTNSSTSLTEGFFGWTTFCWAQCHTVLISQDTKNSNYSVQTNAWWRQFCFLHVGNELCVGWLRVSVRFGLLQVSNTISGSGQTQYFI